MVCPSVPGSGKPKIKVDGSGVYELIGYIHPGFLSRWVCQQASNAKIDALSVGTGVSNGKDAVIGLSVADEVKLLGWETAGIPPPPKPSTALRSI